MSARLLLIDALGLVYRAFYAIPTLTTSAGQPTNAVLGFIKTMRHLQHLWEPSHCAVIFDGGIPPVRRALLPAYKAQRPPMPEHMRAQLPLIEEYLAGAGITAIRRDAVEADDIMATLATRAAADIETLVVTSDKDLMQIVSERIALIIPGKAEQKVDRAAVYARIGVYPDQVVDWLALTGDNADNIPGVPGVGAKTAARWLQQFQNLNGILAHQSELKPEKYRTTLPQYTADLQRNAKLTRLVSDLPGLPAPETLTVNPPDISRLLSFYRAQELHALERELAEPTLF